MDWRTKFVPGIGRQVKLMDRHAMRRGHPDRRFGLRGLLEAGFPIPAPKLPVDWTKGDSAPFPILGNGREGDCMYAAALHADQTFTANNGAESVWDEATVLRYYEKLSGGDNGLDEGALIGEWKAGLCGDPHASILDALDVDPNDAQAMQACVDSFGGVVFMLAVPDPWIDNFKTGYVWDAPAVADEANGHGVWLNGVDSQGRYKLQTWGTHGWLTQRGVKVCDPSAFAVFSLRWFDARGVAPNGKTYDQAAAYWRAAGGKDLPPNPFVNNPPPPGPNPAPAPAFSLKFNQRVRKGERWSNVAKQDIEPGKYDSYRDPAHPEAPPVEAD